MLVEPTVANARRVGAALAEFGFLEIGKAWRWFTQPYRIQMLGRLPLRIDVLTSISGVSFATAWRNRAVVHLDGGDVPVIGLVELRANKVASGRPKDLSDVVILDELLASRVAARSRSRRRSPAALRSRRKRKP